MGVDGELVDPVKLAGVGTVAPETFDHLAVVAVKHVQLVVHAVDDQKIVRVDRRPSDAPDRSKVQRLDAAEIGADPLNDSPLKALDSLTTENRSVELLYGTHHQ